MGYSMNILNIPTGCSKQISSSQLMNYDQNERRSLDVVTFQDKASGPMQRLESLNTKTDPQTHLGMHFFNKIVSENKF